MSKLVRDGKVAVIVSPGFGAGWSTWNNDYPDMDTNAELVQCILEGADLKTLEEVATRLFPDAYLGGLRTVKVEWLPEGTQYIIDEYDGAESIQTSSGTQWRTA